MLTLVLNLVEPLESLDTLTKIYSELLSYDKDVKFYVTTSGYEERLTIPNAQIIKLDSKYGEAGGFLYVLDNILSTDCKYVLKLTATGLERVAHYLAGTQYRIKYILHSLDKAGMLGLEDDLMHYDKDKSLYIGNLVYLSLLAQALNLPLELKNASFFAGANFWINLNKARTLFQSVSARGVYDKAELNASYDWYWIYRQYRSLYQGHPEFTTDLNEISRMKTLVYEGRGVQVTNYRASIGKTGNWIRDSTVDAGCERFFGLMMRDAGLATISKGNLMHKHKVKLLSLYFPQYHQIPENDKNWGIGFTDWKLLQPAEPTYQGQIIRKPVPELGYYNLESTSVRAFQAQLAKNYGIGGFCYYHYWFAGEKVMYKPLEALLIDSQPDLPFCLHWANEPWTRRWDGLAHDVILAQDYGGEADWIKHFNYLLPFFKHPHYIRIGNKPLLFIYRYEHIDPIITEKMFTLWRNLALDAGLAGLFIMTTLNCFDLSRLNSYLRYYDGVAEFQPNYINMLSGVPHVKLSNRYYNYKSYEVQTNNILALKRRAEVYFRGLFTGWDNTVRSFNRDPTILAGITPDNFKRALIRQIENAIFDPNPDTIDNYILINAWNEWAEQAVLEPDNVFGYGLLEAVKAAITYFD